MRRGATGSPRAFWRSATACSHLRAVLEREGAERRAHGPVLQDRHLGDIKGAHWPVEGHHVVPPGVLLILNHNRAASREGDDRTTVLSVDQPLNITRPVVDIEEPVIVLE